MTTTTTCLDETNAALDVRALAAIVAAYSVRHRAFYELHEAIELTPLSALRVTQRTGEPELRVLVEDAKFRMGPTLAVLREGAGGDYEVVSVDAQCPSCFGVGILPDDVSICDTCGGSGWGVAGCETIDVTNVAAREPELVLA